MAWLQPADRYLVGLTLLIKGMVLLLGISAVTYYGAQQIRDALDALEIWNRWDAPHYLDIAVFGYMANDPGNLVGPNGYQQVYPGDLDLFIVFYPLYPWLTGAVNALIGQPLLAAFVVTTVASLFVAPLLYHLVRADESPDVALRAAWFCLVFPTAYFLHIPYTEALFLALVLGSFLAARGERWWLAGALGGLAALTRVNGLILVPALAAEAGTQWLHRPTGERGFRREWLAIGLVVVGFAVYLGLNQAVYGNPFEFSRILDEHWFKRLAPPWVGLDRVFGWFGDPIFENVGMYGMAELGFILLGLAGTVFAAFRLRPAYFTWMAGNWLLFISTSFVLSVPRYSLTLFPLFISLGLATRRRELLVGISVAFVVGFIYFGGRFATGRWAF